MDNNYPCLHLVTVKCCDENCPKPNNHFYCRGCKLNIDLPESHTYEKSDSGVP